MAETSISPGLFLTIIVVICLVVVWWILASAGQNEAGDPQNRDWDALVDRNPAARDMEAKLLDLVIQIAAEHARALYIKSKQLVSEDAYGNRDSSRYYEEIIYFIQKVICGDQRFIDLVKADLALGDPLVASICGLGQATLRKKIGTEILEFIDCYEVLTGTTQPDWEATDPLEFEALCAQKMGQAGWDAQLTKGSGDQGADIICRKGDVSMVVQCKLYSSPIGNKAVQEAFAAKTYYDLHHAAVVSNQTYTKSAVKLANMTGVLLLHFHELDGVDDLIAARGTA